MQGAQLAFIDVAASRPASTLPVDHWDHDSHAALLCYTWSNSIAPPTELRLIAAVHKALATARQLGDVDRILAQMSEESDELDYRSVLPERLKTLVLARP
jgi:hypothetical protein